MNIYSPLSLLFFYFPLQQGLFAFSNIVYSLTKCLELAKLLTCLTIAAVTIIQRNSRQRRW